MRLPVLATLTYCISSGDIEIDSKLAFHTRNSKNGRTIAQVFPIAKYFHYVGSKMKEKKKELFSLWF